MKKPIHEDTDMEEKEEGNIPSTDDMEKDEYGESSKSTVKISKEELKEVMKEIQLEDRLKYTVDCRNIEELEMIIKMANAKISELKKNGNKKEVNTPSKY